GEAKRLARGTRAKIRNTMSALYNHAIRWQIGDKNPISGPVKGSGVRVSAKRMSIPDILTVDEMQKMISAVRLRERVLLFLDMVTGVATRRAGGFEMAGCRFSQPAAQCESFGCGPARWEMQDGDFPKTGPYRRPYGCRSHGVVPGDSLPGSRRL